MSKKGYTERLSVGFTVEQMRRIEEILRVQHLTYNAHRSRKRTSSGNVSATSSCVPYKGIVTL